MQTTTYYVVLADQYGCSDTLSVTVNVDPLPFVDAGRDTSFQYGEGVQLYVASPGGRFYQWDPPFGLNNANIPDPYATPENTTTYIVNVIDTNGCKYSDSVNVRVIKDAGVGIPDAFTPNADGVNDEFRIALLRYQRVTEFRVFDRWGKQVWMSNAGNGNMSRGWDGRYPDGRAADAGTYNYIVRLVWPDGSSKMYKGTVLLLR
jgi:gliding motility-associated-like protein